MVFLILDVLAVLLMLAARCVPGFADLWYRSWYQAVSLSFGRLLGLVPFSLAEILLYAGLTVLFCDLFLSLLKRKPGRFVFHFFAVLSVLFFLYSANCGVNYRRTCFSEEAGLERVPDADRRQYLDRLCTYLTEELDQEMPELMDKRVLSYQREAPLAMEKLGRHYPGLRGHFPLPKPLFVSWILSIQGVTGVYVPFTLEASVNRDMTAYDIPFTMCHELSHLRGYMQESEANLIGILASVNADDPYFRYSGLLSAWVYAGNDLYKEDPSRWKALYLSLPEAAKRDLADNAAFWDQYEGKVSEVQDQVNDAYLKANGQEAGIRSYDQVTELLLGVYRKNNSLYIVG